MIDTHSHLDFRQYKKDRAEVIKRSQVLLRAIINVGAGLKSSRDAVDLAKKNDRLYATIGLHPQDTEPELELPAEKQLDELKNLANNASCVVAIGETGLDYSLAPPGEKDRSKTDQKQLFYSQIDLAKKLDLPVIVHSREAFKDTLAVLKERSPLRAVFHCFTFDSKSARQVLDLGLFISFTGIVTFKNAKVVHDTVKYVPLDRIMVETDAPFLAPVPYRGERCEPWMVKFIAQKIAELKKVKSGKVEEVTDKNAIEFFGLSGLELRKTS